MFDAVAFDSAAFNVGESGPIGSGNSAGTSSASAFYERTAQSDGYSRGWASVLGATFNSVGAGESSAFGSAIAYNPVHAGKGLSVGIGFARAFNLHRIGAGRSMAIGTASAISAYRPGKGVASGVGYGRAISAPQGAGVSFGSSFATATSASSGQGISAGQGVASAVSAYREGVGQAIGTSSASAHGYSRREADNGKAPNSVIVVTKQPRTVVFVYELG